MTPSFVLPNGIAFASRPDGFVEVAVPEGLLTPSEIQQLGALLGAVPRGTQPMEVRHEYD